MLKTIIEKNHYVFHESFSTWQEAIRAGAQPLLDDGTIEEPYVDAIIECVNTYGPYIVICPNVAIPHSVLGSTGVNSTDIAFMRVEKDVVFDPNDPGRNARLFFTLAATDKDQHLANMAAFAKMICKNGLLDDLLEAKCAEDVLKIAEKYEED